MKWTELNQLCHGLPFFKWSMIPKSEQTASFKTQVYRWVKAGRLEALRSGLYRFPDTPVSGYYMANHLYEPSYISLETALHYYGLIPDAVFSIQSLSQKKTRAVSTLTGQFDYHHIQPKGYDGFVMHDDTDGRSFMMATPEKALVDFFYFKLRDLSTYDAQVFTDHFRLQNTQALCADTVWQHAANYGKKNLTKLVALWCETREDLA